MMPDRNAVEQAYAFFHQKLKVYEHSPSETEKDHIEEVIGRYADTMSPALYGALAEGKTSFLKEHVSFAEELKSVVEMMGKWLESNNA